MMEKAMVNHTLIEKVYDLIQAFQVQNAQSLSLLEKKILSKTCQEEEEMQQSQQSEPIEKTQSLYSLDKSLKSR